MEHGCVGITYATTVLRRRSFEKFKQTEMYSSLNKQTLEKILGCLLSQRWNSI